MNTVSFNESHEPDLASQAKSVSARLNNLSMLATNYPPLPPGNTKPLEGVNAINYWGDYIFSQLEDPA